MYGLIAALAIGQAPIRIEEKYSLVIAEPRPAVAVPQVCIELPTGATGYCQLHLNCAPGWALGGLALQAWQGNWLQASEVSETRVALCNPSELVQWCHYLEARPGGNLAFGIATGESQTWGPLGGVEIVFPGTLSAYYPAASVPRSGIMFGANRVQSLTLLEVWIFYDDGSTTVDYTPRIVYIATSQTDN